MIEYVSSLVILTVVIVILFIVFEFWNNVVLLKNALSHDKFKIILTIISTIASVVFGSAVVLQVVNFSNQRKIEEIDAYTNISKILLDDILEVFLKHPDMYYFYEELFQINKINNNTTRNFIKEHLISMLIFSKCAKFAIHQQESTNEEAKLKVQKWVGHIFDTMMKSDILREYWINEYKPKLSGPATQKYMELHFGL